MEMPYRRLGSAGIKMSVFSLGSWVTFANQVDRQGGIECMAAARAAGVNFFDNAEAYSAGRSETLMGEALAELGWPRHSYLVSTKFFWGIHQGPNTRNTLNRKYLLEAVDQSLERLGLDHVDLYQIHGWDPNAPMEEGLRALEDIVRSGRARYVGVSNWAAWQIAKALGIQERNGWDKYVSLQAFYAVSGRDLEREIVPMLTSEGLGLMVWSPLAGGLLSGKYERDAEGQVAGEGRRAKLDFPRVDKAASFDAVDAMRPMAEARGVSVTAIALAWLLHRPVVSSVIVGAKRADQLEQNLAASGIELTSEELAALEPIGALEPEYPAWAIEAQDARHGFRISPRRPKA